MNGLGSGIAAACVLLVTTPLAAEPAPTMSDLAWLAGTWEGEGIQGRPATEVYSPAANGQMVGHFRQLKADGSAMFFEIITIGPRDGVLTYSLKHFNADLTGWEERDEVRHFPLTSVKDGRWDFSGVVYDRTGPDKLTVTVATKEDDGSSKALTFRFNRVKR